MHKSHKKSYRKRKYRNLNYHNLLRENESRDRKNDHNSIKNMYFIVLINLKIAQKYLNFALR